MEKGAIGINPAYRLYVGNVGFRITPGELKAMVEPFGTVESVELVRDRLPGLARGFAIVEMSDLDGAARAVAALRRKKIDGHGLIIRRGSPVNCGVAKPIAGRAPITSLDFRLGKTSG